MNGYVNNRNKIDDVKAFDDASMCLNFSTVGIRKLNYAS